MNDQLHPLLDLQKVDVQITRINNQLAALDGAKELKSKYIAARSAAEKADKNLKALESELKDNELKLKTIDEKRSGFEKRLYGGAITNPKELSATEKEIEILKAQQGELDGRTLELYELVESARASVTSTHSTLEAIEKQARIALKKESAEKTRLEAELEQLTAQRNEAVVKVTDKSLLSRYDAIRKRNGGVGLALVLDGKCGGCHVSVTNYTIRNLYTIDETQFCENCGRILMVADQ
ncbi:MAG: hypothetical protein ABFD54_16525 [Armatimonadota bacterium]|nr:hypothetical protein [bacterium]